MKDNRLKLLILGFSVSGYSLFIGSVTILIVGSLLTINAFIHHLIESFDFANKYALGTDVGTFLAISIILIYRGIAGLGWLYVIVGLTMAAFGVTLATPERYNRLQPLVLTTGFAVSTVYLVVIERWVAAVLFSGAAVLFGYLYVSQKNGR